MSSKEKKSQIVVIIEPFFFYHYSSELILKRDLERSLLLNRYTNTSCVLDGHAGVAGRQDALFSLFNFFTTCNISMSYPTYHEMSHCRRETRTSRNNPTNQPTNKNKKQLQCTCLPCNVICILASMFPCDNAASM